MLSKNRIIYLIITSLLIIQLVNLIYWFDLKEYLEEYKVDDSNVTSELPSKTEIWDIYDYAYNLALKNDFTSAKDTVKYVKDYIQATRSCSMSESELYSIFLNSQQWSLYYRHAINFWKTTIKEIAQEKEKFSKACLKLSNCINWTQNDDNVWYNANQFTQCRNIFTNIFSLSKTNVNKNRKLEQSNAWDDMYANWDTDDSSFDLLYDIEQISKLMYKDPEKPQKINYYQKSWWWMWLWSLWGWWGWGWWWWSGGWTNSSTSSSSSILSGFSSSNISTWSSSSSISNSSSSIASAYTNQLQAEYESTNENSLFVSNSSSSISYITNVVKNSTNCTSWTSYQSTSFQSSSLNTSSVYSYNSSLWNYSISSSSSQISNSSQASSYASSVRSTTFSWSSSSWSGSSWGWGGWSWWGGWWFSIKQFWNPMSFKCNGWNESWWEQLLDISICSVQNKKWWVSWSKKVMSIEEIVDELDNMLTNMNEKWALMKHKHTDEYMETALQDIKLKDIFSFDMVIWYKPIFKKWSKNKDKQKNEKKEQEEQNEKWERYILKNYQDETIKEEKNKYLVIWDPATQDAWSRVTEDPGLKQINTSIIDQYSFEKEPKINNIETTWQTKIYNAVFEQVKDFIDGNRKWWEAISESMSVVRKTSKALKEKVEWWS